MPGPYKGLRVVEFGRFIAAPYCGQLFADGGADVIKVEPLVGDDARRNGTRLSATEARQYLNKNRGKRSIAIDLGDEDVRGLAQKLAASADVVLTNFRPGQAERLGLDYPQLVQANPRLIYAENTAFGKRGPMSAKAGMDILLQAYAGIASPTADGPQMNGEPIIDYTAALLMAWGIASALYHREKTGKGQRLDVSLLQAALVIQNNSMNHVDAVDEWRGEFVEYLREAFSRGDSLATVIAQRETLKPQITPPYYGLFPTQNGFLAIAAGGLGLRRKVAEILDIDDPGLADLGFEPEDVVSYTRAIRAQVVDALSTRTTEEWQRIFEAEGVPAGAVNFREQVLDDSQCWENDYLVRLEHEEVGGMTVVAPPVKFEGTPLVVQGPTPTLGKHTREVLQELGVADASIDALIADGKIVVRGGETDDTRG
jgi:crotonobetainyl-CoA:carnitine CoA-transferase CaiB-like acyl-CoA transferase